MRKSKNAKNANAESYIDIMEKNHMEIPWHDYASADSKSRHDRLADVLLVICRRYRIHAICRDHALHVVVGESQVVQQCQQYIRRIAVALAGICLVQLVDDEYEVRFSSL